MVNNKANKLRRLANSTKGPTILPLVAGDNVDFNTFGDVKSTIGPFTLFDGPALLVVLVSVSVL